MEHSASNRGTNVEYKLQLENGEDVIYSTVIDLEYVPECFIFEDDVYIVGREGSGFIFAEISTPAAIKLKKENSK